MLFGPGSDDNHVTVGFYLYHLDQRLPSGDKEWWRQEMKVGQWYCVEGRVRLNHPGEADGELWGFVDESPVYYRDNIRYRGGSHEHVGISAFWFNNYLGGKNTAKDPVVIDYDSLGVADQRIGCDDSTPPGSGSFADDDRSIFEKDIEALAAADITRGCAPGRFCPDEPVTRGQRAAFLTRALKLAGGEGRFVDTAGHVFGDDIAALAVADITRGCNPQEGNTNFCPDDFVTRGEVAAFQHRASKLDVGR